MSKTVKHQKTKGFLDRIANERRSRKVVRMLKADPMMQLFDISPKNRHQFAQIYLTFLNAVRDR